MFKMKVFVVRLCFYKKFTYISAISTFFEQNISVKRLKSLSYRHGRFVKRADFKINFVS